MSPPIELELAVARDREYLVRAVFRSPAVVSIGTNPRAAITLPDDQLPDYFELVHLATGADLLRFERGMQVEWQVAGAICSADELVSGGHASEGADAFALPLAAGSKGLVRFGPLRVLVKIQAARDATIWSATLDGGPVCGGCGAPLKWALASPGALSPCQRCGDLNRVEGSIADRELGRTAQVPTFSRPRLEDEDTAEDDRGTVDAPKPVPPPRGGDLPTYDGIMGPKGSDLPTFDAIEAGKMGDLPPTAAVLKAGLPKQAPPAAPAPLAPPPAPLAPPPAPGPPLMSSDDVRGASLPTFDAISAFKGDALNTRAAISAMRGGSPGQPPVQLSDSAPSEGVPVAPPAPAVPPPAVAPPPPRVPSPRAAQLPPEPDTDPGTPLPEPPAAPAPPAPGDDGATQPHRYPAPAAPATKLSPPSPDLPSPGLPEPALESTPDLRKSQSEEPDEDDFLMGRHDGGIRMQPNVLGWILVGIGLLCGMMGAALIVFAAARYKGLI